MADGVQLIRAERLRQRREEHWSREHDLMHTKAELARAAAIYALPEGLRAGIVKNALWPWDWAFKPTPDDRIRELVKAGALIAAEIDRLQAANPEREGG